MKNKVFTFLYLYIILAMISCTSVKQKTFIKANDEDMQHFIERIIPEINAEKKYELIEWYEWKIDETHNSYLLILKNTVSNALEFEVLLKKNDDNYELHLIAPKEKSEYPKYTNVTWTFPYHESTDLNKDDTKEFVLLARVSGIMENEGEMIPVDKKLLLCFEFEDEDFFENINFQNEMRQLSSINAILNQPKLSIAGQGTLTSTNDILAFLQEINFLSDGSENKEFVSLIKQEEIFAYDKCVENSILRTFKNESHLSDPAYLPVYSESGEKVIEYTIQAIEELSENHFELSVIAVQDLQNQIFDTQVKMHIIWNIVWILEKEEFYYTTKENTQKLKQVERDCPEV